MEISISDLLKLNNPNVIDIRAVQNYNNNHIPGAKNISYNDLLINPQQYLNKNDVYYIYCKHGRTSKGLCQMLQKKGYKVYSVIGGYEAWVLDK